MTDSLILMVMALVVFGPRRLPQIGRQIGKLMYEFRKASNDFKFQMEEELRTAEEADRRKKEEERQRAIAAQTSSEQASVSADPALQTNPVDSTYPGEGQYPPATEESTPRIMPPSTGEMIAADRPSAGVRSSELAPQAAAEESLNPATNPVASPEATADQQQNSADAATTAAEALNEHG